MSEPIRVGVFGARGKMGSYVSRSVDEAPDMELVAMVDSGEWAFNMADAGAQVAVDFTRPDSVMQNIRWCIDQRISVVVGTSGVDLQRLATVEEWLKDAPDVGVFVAPNFALGAVLMMLYAQQAAQHFESVEILEQHHPDKLDAPSGTAVHTAGIVSKARRDAGKEESPDATERSAVGARGADVDGVQVHSMRLRGVTASQEVWFGNPGETLTLRHDSHDRTAFMPGVLMAIRGIVTRTGLTVGLDKLL